MKNISKLHILLMTALVASNTVQPFSFSSISNFVANHKGKLILAAVTAVVGGATYHAHSKTKQDQQSVKRYTPSRLTVHEEFLIRAVMPCALLGGAMIGTLAALDTAVVASLGLSTYTELAIVGGVALASMVPIMVISEKAAKAYENYKSQEPF